MSQRYFSSTFGGRSVDVLTGWDRPLQHFFLTVFWAPDVLAEMEEAAEADGHDPDFVSEVAYSSMDDPDASLGGGLSLEQLFGRLAELAITPPPELRADLLHDREHDAGNLQHRYRVPG